MEKLIRCVVGLQYLKNLPETLIFFPFSVADYSRLGGTSDWADFHGPIARPVSDDFRHFFTQIATEYDGDPTSTVADYSRLGGTADSADIKGPIA